MEIIRAGMQEAGRAAALAQLLWPGHAQAELEQELAGYLGVDRSAMSNELSKMKAEGLLEFQRNHFVLYERAGE